MNKKLKTNIFVALCLSSSVSLAAVKCDMTIRNVDTVYDFTGSNAYDPLSSAANEQTYSIEVRKSSFWDKNTDCPFFVAFFEGNQGNSSGYRNADLGGNYMIYNVFDLSDNLMWPTTASNGAYLLNGVIPSGDRNFTTNFKLKLSPNYMPPKGGDYTDKFNIQLYSGDYSDYNYEDVEYGNISIDVLGASEFEDMSNNPTFSDDIGSFSLDSLVDETLSIQVVSNYDYDIEATSANSQLLVHDTVSSYTIPYTIKFNNTAFDLSSGNAVNVLSFSACPPTNDPTQTLSSCPRDQIDVNISTTSLYPNHVNGIYRDTVTLDIIPQ